MGCICVKDWLKSISPLFLSWLLLKLKESNAHRRFSPANVYSQVTPIFRVICFKLLLPCMKEELCRSPTCKLWPFYFAVRPATCFQKRKPPPPPPDEIRQIKYFIRIHRKVLLTILNQI